jgi:hypothetical protein
MGNMTTRRVGIALLGVSLSVAVVYVPACEYDPNGSGHQPVQPANPTYTRAVEAPQTAPAADAAAHTV